MASISFFEMTNEELQRYMNTTVSLLAQEMVKDGLITNADQITDRYLALIVNKGKFAKMFDRVFGTEEKEGAGRLMIVRVDNTDKEQQYVDDTDKEQQ
jgi:hypothetical protein